MTLSPDHSSEPDLPQALLLRVCRICVVTLAGLTAFGYLARWVPLAELTTHFTHLYLVCAVAGVFVAAGYHARITTALAALLVFVHAVVVLPWYFGKPEASADRTPNLKILSANVLTLNPSKDAFLELVREWDPDVIFVQEFDRAWLEALRVLEGEYPYSVQEPRADNFGIALCSRIPLTNARVNEFADAGIPGIRADLIVNGRLVTLLNLHTWPPAGRRYTAVRNAQLEALTSYVNVQEGLVIVAGDFNMAMWSPQYKRMERRTGLHSARRGFGIVPTWPAMLPLLKIPIDHCLVSEEIVVLGFRAGPDIGSDHLPLQIDLFIP